MKARRARLWVWPRVGAVAVVLIVVGAACSNGSPRAHQPRRSPPGTTPASPVSHGDLILSSSFEQPVCGRYHGSRGGCEFGVEGDVQAGSYGCRTGAMCVRIQRLTLDSHEGVLAIVPFPGGHAFVGVGQRVPAIPDGAIPASPGYIELEQLSPTDGSLPAWPVEVRLYPDRRLGLALYQGRQVAMLDWPVPIDQWFYVVVEVANGAPALQRMWIYDMNDQLVSEASAQLDTRRVWVHAYRDADKIGGVTSTLAPMYTYADDWYIAAANEGPLHIGADGRPAPG